MVALVFCGDLKYCPYITRYIERLEQNNVKYKVYFWNRSGFKLNLPSQYVYYDCSSKLTKSKWGKGIDFLKFRAWILKCLKEENPNKIIALSTLTGVVLGKNLYCKDVPYIFDIRDYSYEHIRPFFSIEKKVIESSTFTAISSKCFECFLPHSKYVIAHNFDRNDIKAGASYKKTDGKIKFVWNGVVRYFEFQKQYIDALKNDERFEIVFHGDGPELHLYQEYCKNNNINNVIFTGLYDNEKKYELLKDASILNNCYGYTHNAGNKLKYAVSNRFYDGMIYHIPQLVEPEGYKPKWAKKLGIGVSFMANDSFADNLYEYYINIDGQVFDNSCNNALKQVICEDDEYINRIDMFIME